MAESKDPARGEENQPKNASDQVAKLLIEDVVKTIKLERTKHKDRVVVTVE